MSFDWCGQTIVLYKSAQGTKITDICLQFNILNKRGTCWHSKFMRTKIYSHCVPILLPFVLYNNTLSSNIAIICIIQQYIVSQYCHHFYYTTIHYVPILLPFVLYNPSWNENNDDLLCDYKVYIIKRKYGLYWLMWTNNFVILVSLRYQNY